jgi:hypothetical protein
VSKYLTKVERSSGETGVLLEKEAWDEFFVVGDRIYFKELTSKAIYSVGLDGENLREYFKMPFYKGVMADGVMYFIAEPDYTKETVLYRYSLADGVWSSTVLSGNIQSPMRRTVEFAGDRVYYIIKSGSITGIMEYMLDTQEKRLVYPQSPHTAASIPEIILSGGKLYFKNSEQGGFCALDEDGEFTYYNVPGDRICGILDDEILFSDTGDVLSRGNTGGQVSECVGGVVLASNSSKALILRGTSGGGDKIALVKYPEDIEQKSIEGTLYKIYKSGGYALIFLYNSEKAYFVDMDEGGISPITVGELNLTEVSLDKYLKEAKNGGVIPAEDELKDALPVVIANIFAEAVARNDRITQNTLLPKNSRLPPYAPIYMKSWKITLVEEESGETTVVYKIDYVPYSETDLVFSDYWPDLIKSKTLKLSLKNGAWKIS